ncbi:hypothetical protein ACCT22_25780, partial [Rhizobium johnstonii]|uniref:hypothetical protein n=1 Tax=Rhizobium johnstonii TaxID=3019933 RepID=UPI003F9CE816
GLAVEPGYDARRPVDHPTPFQPTRRAGHLYARAKMPGSDVPRGMPVANRLCPDENLLRQNAAI